MSVEISFELQTGLTLLKCINYLFASIQDVESIKDDKEKMDAMELAYTRAVDDMQSITDDEMKGMFDKLEELRLGLIKEDQSGAAHDIPVVEMDEASSSVTA